MKLVNQVEIYRIASLYGLYSKSELIKFLDDLILELEEVPWEIIEASLKCNIKFDDAAHILKEYVIENGVEYNIVKSRLLHIQ